MMIRDLENKINRNAILFALNSSALPRNAHSLKVFIKYWFIINKFTS